MSDMDRERLEAMEHGEKFRYLPVKNGKTGPGDQAISRQQMDALKEFVSGKMSQAVDKVLSGEFRAEPFYRGMTHDPCRYCDYSQVCQKDPEFRRKHYHEDITPGAFWEKIGGEELE